MVKDDDIERCLLCPAHIPFVEKMARLATIQENNVKSVDKMLENHIIFFSKLEDLRISMETIKNTALLNQNAVTAQIDQERLKVKPIYWIFAVAGTALVSAITNILVKMAIK